MGTFRQDLRYAIRALWRRPGFAAVAMATLALGMGANTAIFSVFRAVLLAPLPYSEPDRRIMIWSRWVGWEKTWVSAAEVHDYRRRGTTFRNVAAWGTGQVNLTGGSEPERVGAAQVTANLFPALGARPMLGRGFQAGDDASGDGAPVVVLGHGLWQRRFGGDREVIGRTVQLDGQGFEIVGVMPAGFRLPTDYREDYAEPTELWVPLVLDPNPATRGNHGLYAAAELAPGASAAEANAELQAITRAFTSEGLYPEPMRFEAFAVTLEDEILGPIRPALALLGIATFLLLLIACANVINLLLARGEARRREFALRTALGASRARLFRHLLAEVTVLAAGGGALGLLLAVAGTRALTSAPLAGVPRVDAVQIDSTVLAFTAALVLATTVVCSLLPAFRSTRLDLTDSLKDGAQNATAGTGRQRLRGALIVSEMALAVILLVSAGLALRSLWALASVRLGFDPEQVLTLRLSLPEPSYPENADIVLFYAQLVERVRDVPGVVAAGAVRVLPLAATIGDWGVDVEGYVETPGRNAKGDWQVATDGSFEALGERLVAGRWFAPTDRADSLQVAVVNETMARKYWANADAVGGRLRMSSSVDGPWATVVGIVGDLQHNGLGATVSEKFYRPHTQFAQSTGFAPRSMTLVVRTTGDPISLANAVRAEIARMDPALPVAAVRPMTEVVANALSAPRFTGFLLGLFAALALTLAAVGIYGVLSYLVLQRTREIGIRVAIGASPRAVVRLILRQAFTLSLAGVALGLLVALAAARFMASLLYEIQPRDPLTFVGVPLVLLGVALVASLVPAWRAMRVDPVTALRTE